MKKALSLAAMLFAAPSLIAHDSFEITLEIQQKRKTIEVRMEMACSTATAATDPEPSNGVLFEPAEFSEWEEKFLAAAPELIHLVDNNGALPLKSTSSKLSREDDVLILYSYESAEDLPLEIQAPMLNRFPDMGFGVLVTFRDKAGKWYPPFVLFLDSQQAPLPAI
ncbi:hypothetical protein [Pelagicoccus albus]|uniref:Uncharacterized protein n=1 Tax=Pelagicoccus albus TaxID=415222 RepID=A0A7X1E8G4_9BACT|nr:hypothetical protein [Pelagicoccus albus]MBC2606123.1 hypothetical protein [Pelagicoccus albus]